MSKNNRLKSNSQHAKELKFNLQNESETIYRPLETILKQMLRVWAKENVAIRNISGKKSGNHLEKYYKLKITAQRYLCSSSLRVPKYNLSRKICCCCCC